MSDTPITRKAYQSMGKCIRGIRYVPESEMGMLEIKLANAKALCERMTDDVEGLTDEEILDMARQVDGDPDGMAAFIKFTIGLYHKEKSRAEAWRLKYEAEAAK